MNSFLLLPLALLPISFDHSFAVRTDLRGLYDEMSQASIQIGTAEIDDLHEVLCISDWVFIDMDGRRHDWREMREGVIRLGEEQALDSMEQTIQQLVLVPGGATVIVKATAVRNVPADPTAFDDLAQSAQWHDTRQLTETTFFRDSWVETPDAWKLKSREQLTPAKASAGSSAASK